MASELMERDDLTVYVVGGVPRSFRKKLSKFVDQESKTGGGIKLLDEEISDWVITKLRGETRRSHERTPTSAALWRAYRALAAARYHINEPEMEARVRGLRNEIEEIWREFSPLHDEDEGEEEFSEAEAEESAA